MLRKAIPCALLMLFGPAPLSVSNTLHVESVWTRREKETAAFESAFWFVMRHEDPGLTGMITVDRGGRTRFGVSEKAHPEFWKGGPPSLEAAQQLAQVQFWNRHRLGRVDSQEVAKYILDMIYNEGPAAIRLVQEALNDFEFAVVDGDLGAETLAAINRREPAAFLKSLSRHRKLFYKRLAKGNRVNASWLPIWLQRARDGVPKPQHGRATGLVQIASRSGEVPSSALRSAIDR